LNKKKVGAVFCRKNAREKKARMKNKKGRPEMERGLKFVNKNGSKTGEEWVRKLTATLKQVSWPGSVFKNL
jgi:hypothetical protein